MTATSNPPIQRWGSSSKTSTQRWGSSVSTLSSKSQDSEIPYAILKVTAEAPYKINKARDGCDCDIGASQLCDRFMNSSGLVSPGGDERRLLHAIQNAITCGDTTMIITVIPRPLNKVPRPPFLARFNISLNKGAREMNIAIERLDLKPLDEEELNAEGARCILCPHLSSVGSSGALLGPSQGSSGALLGPSQYSRTIKMENFNQSFFEMFGHRMESKLLLQMLHGAGTDVGMMEDMMSDVFQKGNDRSAILLLYKKSGRAVRVSVELQPRLVENKSIRCLLIARPCLLEIGVQLNQSFPSNQLESAEPKLTPPQTTSPVTKKSGCISGLFVSLIMPVVACIAITKDY